VQTQPRPEIRYATSGDVSIAYHVFGAGPPDIVVSPGALSHLEVEWDYPLYRRFFERLATFARVIRFDKRGTGLSDRFADERLPTLEERADDIGAVMDAVGSERATLFGISDGGSMCCMFAASHPDRTAALVLYGTDAFSPHPATDEQIAAAVERARVEWGSEAQARRSLAAFAPSVANDPEWLSWEARVTRSGGTPGSYAALLRMGRDLDVRHILSAIRVPTLVLHRTGDRIVDISQGRLLASEIAGARLVELPGEDHYQWIGDQDAIIDEIEEFVTGVRDPGERNRVLATILFTDIVDSTARALELGDRAWRELLERHHAVIRKELARFRGREIDTAGDGFLASFDGPARAVRFAARAREAVQDLGIEIRAGIHTGECELHGDKLAGVAVHIGARIAGLAGPGEVMVSSTVRDLVAGSGLSFEDRGERELRGLPERWHVYAVAEG
jgi:class 3 adenylate cyclase/alpha-beta hydrolase superfamily lysophospholipase